MTGPTSGAGARSASAGSTSGARDASAGSASDAPDPRAGSTRGATRRRAVVAAGLDSFRTEVLEAELPVVVDFWAPWCAPCRAIGPVLDELAAEFAGRVKFVKVNTDDEQELARAYGIVSIPTLYAFRDGELASTPLAGAHPKKAIRAWLPTSAPT